MAIFKGAGVAIVTPMKENLEINYDKLDEMLEEQIAGGTDAIMDRGFFRYLKNIWLGLDVFNLFDIKNVSSYYWITNIDNQQYAIPNYLTGRQLNVRLIVDF